jgi:hypothetical protein
MTKHKIHRFYEIVPSSGIDEVQTGPGFGGGDRERSVTDGE